MRLLFYHEADFGSRLIFSINMGFLRMQVPSGEYLQLKTKPCNGQRLSETSIGAYTKWF